MKVKCVVHVELDEKQWADTFGVEVSGVRQDVKQYVTHLVQGAEVFGGEVSATVIGG